MEDIIAYSIIAIIPVVVVYGAVLLRRRFVRSREQTIKLRQEQNEWFANQTRDYRQELQDRAKQNRINSMQNVTPTYPNLGNASAQNTSNDSQWRTLGGGGGNRSVQTALGGSGGTTSAQPVTNSSTDLFTGMAIGSLVNSLFSSPSYSRPSSDDSSSQKSSYSSWSDSSSSDSSSSDSGPSSDW